ncbi:hypothetical protein GKE82_12540 [Conexibacter sp. W3-3-2]|uniref:Uncharacterized protein n=1 Tax=Paraconexibacter algicola TaxID=2133960 RepID=A0A2T4UHS5_9ACTN|nr:MULTISPECIES: hypothetical protein [Solirubrobacterales]MTD45097.1 hypothetical protein [Conexibacter sp. W3-3-2]PTL58790.1 hypothetical protein C7Y72_03560 [Paraconexibacter algicola]
MTTTPRPLTLTAGAALAATIAAVGFSSAASAAPGRVVDGDADLTQNRTGLRLEAETRGATRVTFLYGGRSFAARLVEVDDDGSREWRRTVTARTADRRDGARVTFRVRACGADGCTTRTITERVEWDD